MSADERPALRIVRGGASDEDVAVLAVLLSRAGGEDDRPAPARGGWRDPARSFGRMPLPGPGAWRSSGW